MNPAHRCPTRLRTLGTALAACLALAAQAQTTAPGPDGQARVMPVNETPARSELRQLPLWELGLGVGGLRLPHYRGSDQARTVLLPVPLYTYRGQIFKADRDGARAVLLDRRDAEVDISVSASPPTRSRDNRARAGMPDLSPTLELGPNLNLTLQRGPGWKLDLRLPLRASIALRHDPGLIGWISTPNLNLDLKDLAGWNLGLLAGPVLGSRALHGYFYDVDPTQALANRPAYRASGGYAGFNTLAALSRRDGNRWAGFFVKVDSLHGTAFDGSPLLRQKLQWTAGFAVSWVLLRSDTLVESAR